MKRFILPWLLITGVLVPAVPLMGQTNERSVVTSAPSPGRQNHIALSNVPSSILSSLVLKDLFAGQTNALLIDIFGAKGTNNGFLEFLKDLHLRPKVFQATGGGSNDTSLGFEFAYDKALTHYVLNEKSLHPVGISLNAHAKGDVAIDGDNNPNNLIEAGGGIHLFQGLGGVTPWYTPNAVADAILLAEEMRAAAHGGGKVPDSVAKEFTEVMRPQFFYDVQAHGNIETDQQFDNRQLVYGGQVGFVFREWREKSGIAKFNVFDYPFALLRQALRQDDGFHPSGRTFPSVVIGLDQVDPSENGARLAVDPSNDSYGRVRLEIAFKTPVFKWHNDWLYVSAAYRHFQELGASRAIRDAKLDHSRYFVAMLDLPFHFNISYSTGKLPLDRETDQVYAVGWNLNF